MICKFFKNKKGNLGGLPSLDYLLNPQRVKKGTAKILQGDEILTREIIKSLDFKQKVCVGCLSFEEQNIDENTKKELMQSFENALLTPQMQGRYNILWVEHTDKGRLELNFVIPKIDLESKKAFNPYFYLADQKRIDLWGDFVNLNYGFTNPKNPAKEQSIKNINHHAKTFKDHKALDKHFKELALNGLIKSRDELISYIENDLKDIVEITRKGKDYLGLKLPNDKKATRYKGEIYINGDYEDAFKKERKRKQREARELSEARNAENIARIERELNKLIEHKARFIRERYKRKNKQVNVLHRERYANESLEINSSDINSTFNHQHNTLFLVDKPENIAEPPERMAIRDRQKNDINTNEQSNYQSNERVLFNNTKGLNDEFSREYINRIAERKRTFDERKPGITELKRKFDDANRELETRKREFEDFKQELRQHHTRVRELYQRTRERNNELKRRVGEKTNRRIINTTKLRRQSQKLNIERFTKAYERIQPRVERSKERYTNQQQLRSRIQGIIDTIREITNRAIRRANYTILAGDTAEFTRDRRELSKELRSDFYATARKMFASNRFRIEKELKKPERQRLVERRRERHLSRHH